MTNCQRCGAQFAAHLSFCAYCGAQQAVASAPTAPAAPSGGGRWAVPTIVVLTLVLSFGAVGLTAFLTGMNGDASTSIADRSDRSNRAAAPDLESLQDSEVDTLAVFENGERYYSGSTGSDGSTTIALYPPAAGGSLTLRVTGEADLVLSTTDVDDYREIRADSSGMDGSEEIDIITISDETWYIEVSDYHGGSGSEFYLEVYET